MTGPGHAEKEALQREAEEEAVAGQAGAEARSVRARGEGAEPDSPPREGGVCPLGRAGRAGPAVAARPRPRGPVEGLLSARPPPKERRRTEIGGGESLPLGQGVVPAEPCRRNDSPTRILWGLGKDGGRTASKGMGWWWGSQLDRGRGLELLGAGRYRRHCLLPAGLQDGLRSSSNSRSGSRERREEQTDTSDGESMTHHIRRLNQQPSQGLGPRGYDANR